MDSALSGYNLHPWKQMISRVLHRIRIRWKQMSSSVLHRIHWLCVTICGVVKLKGPYLDVALPHPCNLPRATTEVALQFSESCAAEGALQHSLSCSADLIFTKSCAATNERVHAFRLPRLGPADTRCNSQVCFHTSLELSRTLVAGTPMMPSRAPASSSTDASPASAWELLGVLERDAALVTALAM